MADPVAGREACYIARMRVSLAVGVVVSVVAAPAVARADSWSLHILGTIETGWTDNVFSAPTDPQPGVETPAREGDVYTRIQPGLLFAWERPNIVNQFDYTLEGNMYASHDEAWSLSHRAGWRGFFLLTPRSEISSGVQLGVGTLNTFSTRTTADAGQVNVLPSAQSKFVSLDGNQHYSYQVSRETRFTQSGLARLFQTEDTALMSTSRGYQIGGSLGLDRSWRFDAVGLNVGTSFVSLERDAGGLAEGSDQMNAQATVSWRRDLNVRWTSTVDGGITSIVPLDDGDEIVIQPTVGVGVGYFPNWGSAGVQVRRSVAPNLLIAQNTVSDSAIANAWLPLPWLAADPMLPKLSVQGTLGFSRTQIIDSASGQLQSGFDVASVDAALNYAARPGLNASLRYQFIVQDGADDALAGEVFGYYRHTVLLTFHGRWPDRVAAEVPLRSSLRVDRSNLTVVGEEAGASGGGAGSGTRQR